MERMVLILLVVVAIAVMGIPAWGGAGCRTTLDSETGTLHIPCMDISGYPEYNFAVNMGVGDWSTLTFNVTDVDATSAIDPSGYWSARIDSLYEDYFVHWFIDGSESILSGNFVCGSNTNQPFHDISLIGNEISMNWRVRDMVWGTITMYAVGTVSGDAMAGTFDTSVTALTAAAIWPTTGTWNARKVTGSLCP